jgi:hypothetical protein
MEEAGGLLIFVGIVVAVCGDIRTEWPYALGAILVGAGLVVLDRVTGGSN